MNNLIKYAPAILVMLVTSNSVKAQRYDNIYRGADADMLQVQGNSRTEHILKGATIILPNSSDQLNVTLNIPHNIINEKQAADSGFSSPDLAFHLKVDIDRTEIQDHLTSGKIFDTHGFLTLNNITKAVTVQYTPVVSGTEENGNFNIYLVIQFNPVDFSLEPPDTNAQFVIKINDAKVNRV